MKWVLNSYEVLLLLNSRFKVTLCAYVHFCCKMLPPLSLHVDSQFSMRLPKTAGCVVASQRVALSHLYNLKDD